MSRERISATVLVRVVLEVPVGGTWGSDCTVEQAHQQGEKEALGQVSRLLESDTMGRATGVRVVQVLNSNVVIKKEREP